MTKIAFFNNKGGVGKSTSAINVAHAMVQYGKKVLVIDCDNQQNTFQFFTEGQNTDYRSSTRYEKLDITLDTAYDIAFVYDNKIPSNYDYAILDLPPALDERTNQIIADCDFVFVPFELGKFAIQGIAKVTEAIAQSSEKSGVKFGGCFINKFDHENTTSHKLEEMLRGILGDKTMATRIPSSKVIKNSIDYRQTAFEYMGWTDAAGAYGELTQEIMKICGEGNDNG